MRRAARLIRCFCFRDFCCRGFCYRGFCCRGFCTVEIFVNRDFWLSRFLYCRSFRLDVFEFGVKTVEVLVGNHQNVPLDVSSWLLFKLLYLISPIISDSIRYNKTRGPKLNPRYLTIYAKSNLNLLGFFDGRIFFRFDWVFGANLTIFSRYP